jgi:putative flavoprotein involved in K+ transport
VLSGRHTGEVPFRLDSAFGRHIGAPLVLRVLFHRIFTLGTPIGRRMLSKAHPGGRPLIRVKRKQLAAAGVERAPRTVGVEEGRPVLDDGRVLDVENVIWCTGFEAGFSWIDLPVFDDGEPVHEAGIVTREPGLYFVGLDFQYSFSSGMIQGVGRDAGRIAKAVHARVRSARQASELPASRSMPQPDVVGG